MTEPCDLSAVEARRLIGRRSLSPTALLQSCARRIEKTNRFVNAIVAIDLNAARKRAAAIEQALMRGEEIGVLAGLPIGVKDLQATARLKTTSGSLLFKDHVPERDETSVANVRNAGGLILAKTNTPNSAPAATRSIASTDQPAILSTWRRLAGDPPAAPPWPWRWARCHWRRVRTMAAVFERPPHFAAWLASGPHPASYPVISQAPVYSELPVRWPARWRMLISCCALSSATRKAAPETIAGFRSS